MFTSDKSNLPESWPALFMFALASFGMGLEGVNLDAAEERPDLN